MTVKLAHFAIAAVMALGANAATATTIDAQTSGWIFSSGVANNSFGSNYINNHYAGFYNGQYNNFFEFTLPTGTISSAKLSIWNSGNNSTIDPNAFYTVHTPSSESFGGLAAGPGFGSVVLGVVDTGVSHYVDITLNAAGIAYLNSVSGGLARLSGSTTTTFTTNVGCNDCIGVFGYTGGRPVAQLTISNVPEPASWAMLIAGFGLVGAAARRRRTVIAA